DTPTGPNTATSLQLSITSSWLSDQHQILTIDAVHDLTEKVWHVDRKPGGAESSRALRSRGDVRIANIAGAVTTRLGMDNRMGAP
ncbi:MAG TPA: hypothetical protein VMS92_17330, partial [Mycobacterium sp.]|nr:hypothetical protein [Mycobacterium sp.]